MRGFLLAPSLSKELSPELVEGVYFFINLKYDVYSRLKFRRQV